MKWHKQRNNQDADPDIMAAGAWAAIVYRCLCRVSGENDLEGEIPAKWASPAYLASRLRLMPADVPGGDPVQTVTQALEAALTVGLVTRTDLGSIRIPEWDELQGDTGAARKRRSREASRGTVTGQSRDTTGTVTGASGPEERRGEERREEEISPPQRKLSAAEDARARGAGASSAAPSPGPAPGPGHKEKPPHYSAVLRAWREATGTIHLSPVQLEDLEAAARAADLDRCVRMIRKAAGKPSPTTAYVRKACQGEEFGDRPLAEVVSTPESDAEEARLVAVRRRLREDMESGAIDHDPESLAFLAEMRAQGLLPGGTN